MKTWPAPFRARRSPGALSLAALLCWFSMFLCSAASAAPAATVQAVSGQLRVRHRNAGNFMAAGVRTSLNVGDIAATGAASKASLLFSNGAQLRLNANTTIEITSPASVGRGKTGLFRALGGEVWARLRPGQAVQTRSAIAGVRGTEFVLAVAADETSTLTVVEGAVEFFNEFGDVTVGASQRSIARLGAAPTAPVTIDNAGFLLEWTLDLDRAALPREIVFVSQNPAMLQAELAKREMAARTRRDDFAAQRELADVLFDLRRYDRALAQYQLAQSVGTASASEKQQAQARTAYALMALDRIDEAEQLLSPATAEPKSSEISIATAWLELAHNRPVAALGAARAAVAADDANANAHVLLGISALRGGLPDGDGSALAVGSLQRALQLDARNYQAHSWLSMALLQHDDLPAALKEGLAAVQMAPWSALAHGNLSLVYFYAGQTREAKREAELAVRLDPDSVAARVTLGQALLAQGEVDAAAEAAAQAVALDASLPQAHYLLGVADASRRDYTHAERALLAARRLSPDYLAPVSALARVYNAMGRPRDAVTVLEQMLPRHHQTDAVQGALGAVYYEQAKYPEAATQLRAALKSKPNSALYHAELARTLLYSNDLRGAIEAGQNAVRLAPTIGQYHAILGLAYEFSGLTAQAERELREARTRDPQNALALTQLAYAHSGADLRTAAVNFTQGFLLDPAVSRQLLRGGIDTEITPLAGNNDQQNLNVNHRLNLQNGAVHSFGFFGRNSADNSRVNSDFGRYDAAEFLTWTPDPKTNLYLHARGRKARSGLYGADSTPDDDDRSSFRFGQAQMAGRHRLDARSTVWLGLFSNASNNDLRNPDADSFLSPAGVPIDRQRFRSSAFEPEIRFDIDLKQTPARPSILTFGAGYARTRFRDARHLLGVVSAEQNINIKNSQYFGYVQLAGRPSERLSFSAQLRAQRSQADSRETLVGAGAVAPVTSSASRSHILPSILATYQAGPKTTLRLFANKRVTDSTASTFAPAESLITTEGGVQPFGTPDRMQLLQLDVERYVGNGGLVKLFAFETRAKGVQIGGADSLGFGSGLPAAGAPSLRLDKWRARGLGVRYERQLGKNLFANAGYLLRDTTSRTRGVVFDRIFSGKNAPYEPRHVGSLELNYVNNSGYKVGLVARYNGSFFQDAPTSLGRPRFPASTYFDLKLAREASVRHEFFLNVFNLFDRPAIRFNDFSTGGRRLEVGATTRF